MHSKIHDKKFNEYQSIINIRMCLLCLYSAQRAMVPNLEWLLKTTVKHQMEVNCFLFTLLQCFAISLIFWNHGSFSLNFTNKTSKTPGFLLEKQTMISNPFGLISEWYVCIQTLHTNKQMVSFYCLPIVHVCWIFGLLSYN